MCVHVNFQWLTSKASPKVAYVSERVQGVWLGLVGGGAVNWACGTSSGWTTAHTKACSWINQQTTRRLVKTLVVTHIFLSPAFSFGPVLLFFSIQFHQLPLMKWIQVWMCVCVWLGYWFLPVLVVAGLFQSHPPMAFCCWMLTVGVVGGTGELRPIQAHKGLSQTEHTVNEDRATWTHTARENNSRVQSHERRYQGAVSCLNLDVSSWN